MDYDSSGGYGKKFLTPKYIIGYLVAALVVYGLVYYFFFAPKGGNGYGQNQNYGNGAVPSPTTVPSNSSSGGSGGFGY